MVPAYLQVDETLLVLELPIKQSRRIHIEVACKAGTDVVNVPCRAARQITITISCENTSILKGVLLTRPFGLMWLGHVVRSPSICGTCTQRGPDSVICLS